MPASVAQLNAPSDWRPGGRGFNEVFVEIDHEIFSTVIPSLPLIQEGQLSVSGEKKMCTILVNRLEDQACPVNVEGVDRGVGIPHFPPLTPTFLTLSPTSLSLLPNSLPQANYSLP